MSKIALSPPASGTATFTLSAPATNTDRTLTLPDSAGTLATAESTLTQFNASGSAPVYACRAWVNFNGTGTVAIRSSGNVSSISDNGTGDYTVNFTTAMPDANYSGVATTQQDGTGDYRAVIVSETNGRTTTSFRVVSAFTSNAKFDTPYAAIAIFR